MYEKINVPDYEQISNCGLLHDTLISECKLPISKCEVAIQHFYESEC